MDILDMGMGAQELPQIPLDGKWSSYQLDIFREAQNESQNILVNAVAGSGKSTTLREALRFAPGNSILLAFNKAIAEEQRAKVGTAGEVKTLNALGHGLLWRNLRSSELDARKVPSILKHLMGEGNQDYRDFGYTLSRVVGLMKNNAFGLEGSFELDDVVQLIDAYQMEIPFDRVHALAGYAHAAFLASNRDLSTFDFDDQLYLPLLLGFDFPFYSNVFIDECQDLSPIQHLMLEKMVKRGARLIAVGDPHQAIYGFRGALTNSMELLRTKFEMKQLPLSISYRCPLSVIREAQNYCPHIEARPGAPEGLVRYRDQQDDEGSPEFESDPLLFDRDQLVLSRNNAPLFRAILGHVRARSPCRVLTNFLESFQNFIRGFKVSKTSDLIPLLDDWFARERDAALKKGFRGRVAALQDKYETSKLLAREFPLVDEMLKTVERLGKGTTGPTFATIHKSKGLESPRVYILRPDLMPSPFATTKDAQQQEANLIYVAITRAQNELTWGVSPKGF